MRVLNYKAHNVMRIKDIDLSLDGHNLFLVGGKNAQGKSSALKALSMALCGRSGMDDYPEIALRQGEDEGWVTVELSGDDELHEAAKLTVELHLKRRRSGEVIEEFRIKDSAGDEAPEPRTLLRRLYSMKSFDPLEFERLSKKEQRERLLKLLGLDFTKDKVEYKRLYDERTVVNREGVRLKSQIEAMPLHRDAPSQPVDVAELEAEMLRRAAVNAANEDAAAKLVRAKESVEVAEDRVASSLEEIADLKKRLQAAEDKHAAAVDKLQALQEGAVALAAEVDQLRDEDVTEIRDKLNAASRLNNQAAENQRREQELARLGKLRAESQGLSEQMKQIEERQAEAIRAAKFPVDGMSFDDEGVLLNGLPFEQASKRERIMASFRVGMALNPKLRLLVCQDGGDLDEDAIAALDQLLKEHKFQAIVELVTRGSDDELCQVVIRDGEVAPQKPKATA